MIVTTLVTLGALPLAVAMIWHRIFRLVHASGEDDGEWGRKECELRGCMGRRETRRSVALSNSLGGTRGLCHWERQAETAPYSRKIQIGRIVLFRALAFTRTG